MSIRKLYLVQHGESTPEEVDPARPLTEKGRSDVEKVAAFIKDKCSVICIKHSGKTRALQTAEILNAAIAARDGIIQGECLGPNDPIEPLLKELSEKEDNLMIVGHLPYLSKLTSSLLTGSLQNIVAFKQGGIVCLGQDEDKTWQIEWMIIPDLL